MRSRPRRSRLRLDRAEHAVAAEVPDPTMGRGDGEPLGVRARRVVRGLQQPAHLGGHDELVAGVGRAGRCRAVVRTGRGRSAAPCRSSGCPRPRRPRTASLGLLVGRWRGRGCRSARRRTRARSAAGRRGRLRDSSRRFEVEPPARLRRSDVRAGPQAGRLAGTSSRAIASSSTVTPRPGAVAEDEPAVLDAEVDRQPGRAASRSCSSVAMWLGTAVAAWSRPTGVVPIGLTGRSWAWASAATRRKWVTPQPAAVWTTSSAPAARSGRNCSSPVRFSPAATDARTPRPTATMPGGVPAADRLLDPDQVHGPLQLGHVSDRLLAGPRLVGVEHQARPRRPGWRRRGRRGRGSAWPGPGRRPARP